MDKKKPKALITGAGGMLGRYVVNEFHDDYEVTTLGLDSSDDIVCDLTETGPEKIDVEYDVVVHCAGSMVESEAGTLNFEGTKRLLSSFTEFKPRAFVFISSVEVYGKTECENLDETANAWPVNEVGRSKYLAEDAVKEFFRGSDTVVTILRPATMFGKGVKGAAGRLFRSVVSGRYVHVRGNNACRSIVAALDVARIIRKIFHKGGTYNVCDGFNRRFIELVEAMSANAGMYKRMIFLPDKWANIIMRLADRIPGLQDIAGTEVLAANSRTLTFSNKKLAEATDHDFFDTVEVIARRDKNYPYEDDNS